MVRRLIAVLMMAALVVVVYGTGGVAEANEPDYTDPDVLGDLILELEEAEDMQAAFLDLTPAGQQAVIDALFNDVQVDVEISTDEVGAKGSMFNALSSDEDCHAKRASRYAYAIVKSIKVWKYTSRTRWCFDGDEITNDPHLTTAGKVYGLAKLFWDFEGDRTTSQSGGEGDTSASDYAGGHFTFDIPVDISVEIKKKVTISNSLDINWYPSIWKDIYGDGSWDYETDLDHD